MQYDYHRYDYFCSFSWRLCRAEALRPIKSVVSDSARESYSTRRHATSCGTTGDAEILSRKRFQRGR